MAEDIKAFRFYKHSDYLFNEENWKITFDLLTGDQKCIQEKYLWLHPMENPARACDERDAYLASLDRKSRQERSKYINYLSMVRDRFKALVLKGGFNLSDEITELLGEDISNVDGNSNSLQQFAEYVIEDILAYGTAYVLTDVRTFFNQTEQAEDTRPFWNRIHPMDVLDWEIAENGDFKAFRFEYRLLKARESLDEEPFLAHYTVVGRKVEGGYEATTYASVDEKSLQIVNYHPECSDFRGDITNVWAELPKSKQLIKEFTELPLAVSRIDEAALKQVLPVSIKIYNRQSELDNILHHQCYDKLFIMSDLGGDVLTDENPLSDDAKTVKISTNSIVVLPEGSQINKITPTYPQALLESLSNDLQDLFLIAFKMTRVLRADSEIAEAAETKREAKEDLFTEVESWRNKLLDVMNSAIKHYAMAKGQKDFEGKLEYTRQLEEQDFETFSNFARMHSDRIARYETLDKAVDKRLVSFLSLPEQKEVFEDIKNTDIKKVEEERIEMSLKSKERLSSLVNDNGRQESKVRKGDNSSRGKAGSSN